MTSEKTSVHHGLGPEVKPKTTHSMLATVLVQEADDCLVKTLPLRPFSSGLW